MSRLKFVSEELNYLMLVTIIFSAPASGVAKHGQELQSNAPTPTSNQSGFYLKYIEGILPLLLKHLNSNLFLNKSCEYKSTILIFSANKWYHKR